MHLQLFKKTGYKYNTYRIRDISLRVKLDITAIKIVVQIYNIPNIVIKQYVHCKIKRAYC